MTAEYRYGPFRDIEDNASADQRVDLRDTERHGSWREVYSQLEVSTGHELADLGGGDP